MKLTERRRRIVCFFLMLLPLLVLLCPSLSLATGSGRDDSTEVRLEVFGKVLNSHGRGVSDVTVEVFLQSATGGELGEKDQGNKLNTFMTEGDGTYQAQIWLKQDVIESGAVIDVAAFKPGYARNNSPLSLSTLARSGTDYFANVDVSLERKLGPAFYIATVVFILAYILISFELLHRTMAAMLGASIMLVISYTLGTINPEYRILSYASAINAIDMNVIFLLMGMMIIVGILKHTGIFQWSAYKCYQLSRGNIFLLVVILMSFTAVSSAFLDNVTTMLLLTPVTIEIAVSIGVVPLALLIPEILASNIGGTATLIGDPPNIMIGSFAGLTFMEFVENLAPVCVVVMVVLFVYTKLVFGKELNKAKVENVQEFIDHLREEYKITDSTLLGVGLIIIAIVIFLFLTHGIWHMEVSIAALFGASLLFSFGLLTKKVNMLELIEKDIEWTTLLFFMFLFMLVGGVEEAGMLDIVADWVLALSQGNLIFSICLVLWVSAIMSAFVDNIPFTATMLPIVAYLTQVIPGAESGVLWWALAFGACFGGNGTMIGASANVVTLGISEAAGHPVRFFGFMKVAFPFMLLSVFIANIWLLVMY